MAQFENSNRKALPATRRQFLKMTSAVAAVSSLSVWTRALAAEDLNVLGAKPAETLEQSVKVINTYHEIHCHGQCMLKGHVKNGRLLALTSAGDVPRCKAAKTDESIGHMQRRACMKGYSERKRLYAPDRLKYPLLQTIERGNLAGFKRISWDEAITTIMLNTIAAYLCQYLAKGPWKNANKNMVAATEQLGAQYWFGNVIPRSNLTSAVFAAAVMAFLVWYVMERTSVGYEMRITGENPRFAFFSGLRTDQIVLLSMVVSGAMCGLVGMFRVYGVEHLYRDSVSKDYYFEALMVAMIAQYKPVTVILLSLFFAVLKIGAQGMELIGIPSQIYLIIQTVIIFCMAAESGITRSLTAAHERRRAKRAAEERLKEELKHG